MTVEAWLVLAGGIAQAAGVVCVGLVLRTRSRRHGYTRAEFTRWLRERLLTRPDSPTRLDVHGSGHPVRLILDVGAITHAPILLPDPTADPLGFRKAVMDQLDELSGKQKVLRYEVDRGRGRLDEIASRIRDEVAVKLDRLEAERKQDVVTVMHLDIIGFALLLAGILASMTGGLLAL